MKLQPLALRFACAAVLCALAAAPTAAKGVKGAGGINEGQRAVDFQLRRFDVAETVQLSSFAGRMPVVLVFGSYT